MSDKLHVGYHEEKKKIVILFERPMPFLSMDADEAEMLSEILREKVNELRSLKTENDEFPEFIAAGEDNAEADN